MLSVTFYCTVITVDPQRSYGVIVLASLMLKSSLISDLISAVCMFLACVLKSAVWIWLVSHSFITGWWYEVMMKMMMARKGNTDRSVLLVVSFLHNQTCGCFVTSITLWLTFCQYQFYSYYTMTVMMADVVPADCLYVYLLYIYFVCGQSSTEPYW